MTIKPIDTIYKGYKFRSRLEARWAVFFDAAGLIYEYEAEGYNTKAGWYLPDFWMPDTETFIEIKPRENLSLSEWPEIDPRWEALEEQTGHRFVVICGTPGRITSENTSGINGDESSYKGVILGDLDYFWTECFGCGCVDIQFEGRSTRNGNHHKDCVYKTENQRKYVDGNHNYNTDKLNYAYDKARQARFE